MRCSAHATLAANPCKMRRSESQDARQARDLSRSALRQRCVCERAYAEYTGRVVISLPFSAPRKRSSWRFPCLTNKVTCEMHAPPIPGRYCLLQNVDTATRAPRPHVCLTAYLNILPLAQFDYILPQFLLNGISEHPVGHHLQSSIGAICAS